MSNLNRGPSINASYQVSVHLANWFQRRRFLKIDQSETKIAYGGHGNLVGRLYGRSSMKSAYLDPICYQTWPPQANLVSDWLISKKSSPLLKER
jgi:hypothetical protein